MEGTTGVGSGALAILALIGLVLTQPGCAVRCGPVHTLPTQRVHLITPSPGDYSIRVVTGNDEPIDTPVPTVGRVSFEVPIGSRNCTAFLFGVIKLGSPRPVEDRRVIHVMKGERVVRRLSARDIAKLATDSDGYRILAIER